MKSAYELAMERLGGTHEYDEETKARFAEIDSRYDAKVAEAKLGAENQLKGERDPSKADTIREHLAQDLARLKRKREDEKEKIRKPQN